jgi:hypothetical protein
MNTKIKSLVWRLRFLRLDEERCAEAADELEKMDALLSEVARLREALEFIARGTTGSPDTIVARKALEASQ